MHVRLMYTEVTDTIVIIHISHVLMFLFIGVPFGIRGDFFAATLAVTAIVVSVESTQYHYDQGVWYTSTNGGYTAVPAPVGGTVNNIPSGAETVNTGTVNNYYYGGTYYEKDGEKYTVVAPTAGTIVENLPEGGEEVTIGDAKYVKFGETYYQPVKIDGKDKYEVVQVEKE